MDMHDAQAIIEMKAENYLPLILQFALSADHFELRNGLRGVRKDLEPGVHQIDTIAIAAAAQAKAKLAEARAAAAAAQARAEAAAAAAVAREEAAAAAAREEAAKWYTETSIEVRFENQRKLPFRGFSASFLLPTDRDGWTDADDKAANTTDAPSAGWHWLEDWHLAAQPEQDAEGWEYATNFNTTFGTQGLSSFVRRRRHERTLQSAPKIRPQFKNNDCQL